MYSLQKSSTFSSLFTVMSLSLAIIVFTVISLSWNNLLTTPGAQCSKLTSSPTTPNPKYKHTSNTENGTKYSLIRKQRSILDHLLTNSLTTTFEIWSGSSKHNSHLKGVVSSFCLWNGDISRLIWTMTSVCNLCLTLSCNCKKRKQTSHNLFRNYTFKNQISFNHLPW